MKQFKVEWDRDYGINKRTGWSIVVDGSFVVQLERFLIIAISKTLYKKLKHNLPKEN